MTEDKKEHQGAQRFGGEFGPGRGLKSEGVSLSTFKTLVWISNIGGLLLVVLSLEFLFVEKKFALGLGFLIAGVVVALFPSNYEIKGMEQSESSSTDDTQ
jgi:hypothetical protein